MNLLPISASRRCLLGVAILALSGCATEPRTEEPIALGTGSTMVVESSAGDLRVETLAEFEYPWGMDYLPDGRLLVTEKPGRLRIVDGRRVSPPLSGLPSVEYKGQGGLLDVAAHPDFASNRLVYFYFVERAPEQPPGLEVQTDPRLGPFVDTTDTVLKGGAVARGRLDGNGLRDVEVIWRQTPKIVGLGHYGGRLKFAPDGKLLVTSGERQSFAVARRSDGNLGKLVRLNDDGTIPSDNPYAGAASPRNEFWSIGHRNPLGIDIRPGTSEVWMQEMGPLYGDELNVARRGRDYGWPEVSNGEHYNTAEIPHHETRPDTYERPEFYWRPAISPSGLEFYTGDLFEDWNGDVFIGGLTASGLVRVDLDDGDIVKGDERIVLNRRVRDVLTARDGSLLVLTDEEDGALLRLAPAGD